MNTSSHETTSHRPVPVTGAFEDFEGKREHLITLTRQGRLLEVGDPLPPIPGVSADRPFILHTVNAFGTPTCDKCVNELENFHHHHPEVQIYSLTKQDDNEAANTVIKHTRLRIDQDTAIDLAVALEPGENADPDFWPTALRRMVAVVDSEGKVVHVQHHDDQEHEPDFMTVYEAVDAAA